MSQNNYDIIVIGAGCGGLTAAACAAKKGKKVLLLERHNSPGGFASSFVRGRFEFDVSLHQLCGFSTHSNDGDVRKIFDYLGISDKINWTSINEAYRLITACSDGSRIDLTMPMGVENYINAMEMYVPGSKESLIKLFNIAEEIEQATDYFSKSESKINFKNAKHILKNYGNFLRTATYSVNDVLNAIGMPKKAQEIFTAYWIYLGVDCDRLSFTHYISMVYSYLKYGAVVPTLRSYEISMALAGVIEDNGGEIRYNSHVSRIVVKDSKATGVILKSGEKIYSEHIICNCSPTTVYGKMIKSKDVPEGALKRTNARTFGARGACLYLGLNRSPEDLGIDSYSYFITDTSDSVKQYNLMKSIETNNAQATVCLNVANPNCSPRGTTILCMTTLYTDDCWANIEPDQYFMEKDMLAARLIANFENSTGITIHNSIEELEVATPATFARYTNTPQGTVYGYYGDDWDGVIPRILAESSENEIKGLRFCGGWGVQLSGMSSSIATGRNSAFATLNDIEEEKEENTVEE
ncbi:MAG: NAD(P)/FAD-dependent oxidoreductase [Oscillospiraceae bacterium]|nr:NAD(P)/FAD-dependent oxidoreductase [Oscillospiraceae bacterium]